MHGEGTRASSPPKGNCGRLTGERPAPDAFARAHPTRHVVPFEVAEWLRLWFRLPFAFGDAGIEPVRVDAEAFTRWCLEGVGVCQVSDDAPEPWTPAIQEAKAAAHRLALGMAMERHSGNITHAAAAAGGMARRTFRENLKKHGLYREPETDAPPLSDRPVLTWEAISFFCRLAATSPDPERAAWLQAVDTGIHRIRRDGKKASGARARGVLQALSAGATDIVVATVIPGPVRVSLAAGLVRIDVNGEKIDAGPPEMRKTARVLSDALARFGGPVDGVEG